MRLCNQFFYPHLPNTHQYTGVICIDPSRMLLVAVSKVPLSHGADLCSCLSFPSSAHSASVSFTCGPWYLAVPLHALDWSCSSPRYLADRLPLSCLSCSLSVSPDCCYACFVEFILSCSCSVLSVLCVSHLASTHSQAYSGSSPNMCNDRQSWNHVFHTHAYYVQPGQTDTQLNALPPNDQMWSSIMLTPKYVRSMVCTGGW